MTLRLLTAADVPALRSVIDAARPMLRDEDAERLFGQNPYPTLGDPELGIVCRLDFYGCRRTTRSWRGGRRRTRLTCWGR